VIAGVDISVENDWPRKIYVEPTSRCNLRCRTCVRGTWEEPSGDMAWAVYEALLDDLSQLPGPHTLAFAGIGEPLLHPRFVDMIAAAHQAGMRTEVTTNAILLSPDLVTDLRRAGLDQLVVSIDGCTEQSYAAVRPGVSLEWLVENLSRCRDYGGFYYSPRIRTGIEFVAMRRNVAELPMLGRIAARIGASFVVVSNVLPYSEDMIDQTLYDRVATAMEGYQGSVYVPRWSLPRMDLTQETMAPLTAVLRSATSVDLLDLNLESRNNHCPFIAAGVMAIGWDGHVGPCPPLLHSYRCFVMGREKHVRAWCLGTLPDDHLDSLWQRADYQGFRRRVFRFDFSPCTDCGGCELAETNEEDCFGSPFPACGDCLWARGIIRCA